MNGSVPTALRRVLNCIRAVTEAPTANAHKTHIEYQALATAFDRSMLRLDSLSESFRVAPPAHLLAGLAASSGPFNGVVSFGML
jgi:hypothetical protein